MTIAPGWALATLGDLIDGFEGGRNLAALGRPPTQGEHGVLKVSAVTWGTFDPHESKALPPEERPKAHEIVRDGDLLVSRANTTELVGAAVLVKGDHAHLMLPDKILRLIYRKDIVDARYLLHALRTEGVRNYFRIEATGTSDSMRNLSQPKFRSTPIPLSPLNEQRRIVAKLDALMAKSRRAKKALDAIPPLLDKLRQSILAAAFRGDLTANWRAAHPDVEPASQLLQRIRAERRRRWEEAELAKLRAKGKTPTDDRWKAKYQEPTRDMTWMILDAPTVPVVSGYVGTDAPNGWLWASLLDIARLESGHTPRKTVPEYWDGGNIPWISLQDIRAADGRMISDTKYKPTLLGIENSAARLLPAGTVVFSRDISVGFATVMGKEMATSQHFANWVCSDSIRPKFLMFALIASRDSLVRGGEGTTVRTIYMPALERFSVLLPSLAEQDEIVARLEAALTRADAIEGTFGSLEQSYEQLDSAILAKAFRGELVPQDPNDEPASVLLERIRSESGVQAKPQGRRARSKTA